MLMINDDGTQTGGTFDVLCILHNEVAGTYHAAILVEAPPPGPPRPFDEIEVVRMKSIAHHTVGSTTLDGAIVHLEDLAKKVHVHEANIWRKPIVWNGDAFVAVIANWRKKA